MLAACTKLQEVQPMKIAVGKRDVAAGLLFLALSNGRPLVVVVDQGEHWIAVVGHLKDRVLVADSAHNELVLALSASDFMVRWDCGGRAAFTAIIL